jgi:hypothetical protein
MNDLQTLRAALTPDEPDQDVVDRSRHQLQNRIHGGRPGRKRVGWLSVGVGLTAAAAAAAVAISLVPADDPATPKDNASTVQTVSGKDILLAAATAAERAPAGSGTYWYLKVEMGEGGPGNTIEHWIKSDGESWYRMAKMGAKALPEGPGSNPYTLESIGLTFDQVQALPTEPEALRAAITEAVRNSDVRTSAGPVRDNPEMVEQVTFDSLITLVSTLPASPDVRATAFRAIALYPDVESVGEVPGGQGLKLPEGELFVVDTATGQVTRTSGYVDSSGYRPTVTITTEWTDTLPS